MGMVRKRGSVLILTALILVVAVAIASEVFNLSRVMLEAKQLERIAEPAALRAVLELDGTRDGIARGAERANQAGRRDLTVEFAVSASGPWLTEPADPPRIRFARVTVAQSGARPLTRRSTAAQRVTSLWPPAGLAPFSVEAAGPLQPGAILEIGYFGEPLPREARFAVERGLSKQIAIGDPVFMAPMPGEARLALDQRLRSDSDLDSISYAEYARAGKGNGRRLIPAVLRDERGKATGVAAFFLGARAEHSLRGEYAGGYLQGGRFRAVAETGFAVAEVVR